MRLSAVNGFSGIDERLGLGSKLGVASYMRNFRVTDGGSLVKRNGVAWLWNAPSEVDGIWSGKAGGRGYDYCCIQFQAVSNLAKPCPFLGNAFG